MRNTIRTSLFLACFGLVTAPVLADRDPIELPPCGTFDLLDAATSVFPNSLYDADPECDVETAPPPGCGGEDLVIADQATWEGFWSKHKPWLPLPAVDFDDEVVVASFTGWRRSGGYGPLVTCVRYYEDDLTGQLSHVRVEVLDVSPGPNCNVTFIFTNPYSIIAVDRPATLLGDPNVNVVHTSYVNPCPSGGNDCECGICGVGGGGGGVGQTTCCPCP